MLVQPGQRLDAGGVLHALRTRADLQGARPQCVLHSDGVRPRLLVGLVHASTLACAATMLRSWSWALIESAGSARRMRMAKHTS